MYIIPAIDLIDGKCVRLIQGQYHRRITYHDNPAEQAADFIDAGAEWLHIVDLDGARIGKPVNTEAVNAILALGKLNVEIGGGIRDEAAIQQLLDVGVKTVIIGTQAVNEFEWFAEMTEKFPGRIALGLDARGAKIATHGWTKDSTLPLIDFAVQAAKLPLAAIIYTDITKDGMMAGPNYDRTKALADAVTTPVIASGGVSNIENVTKLKQLGNIEAAIIGRALYEKTIDLKEAIQTAKQ